MVESGVINFNHAYYDASDSDADDEGYVWKSIALDALELQMADNIRGFDGELFQRAVRQINQCQCCRDSANPFVIRRDRRNQITDNQWRDDWSLRNAKLNEMIQAINAVSGQTGVRAEWNTDSGLARPIRWAMKAPTL